LTSTKRNDIALAQARLLLMEDEAVAALNLYQRLEREADPLWIEDHQADILLEKGRCYLLQGSCNEAAANFTKSLELVGNQSKLPLRPTILSWLGSTYRLQGQFTIALHYYEECAALHIQSGNLYEYALILNGISIVYRLQGKIWEALMKCKISLSVLADLFHAGKTGEVPIGFSLSTMGSIYLDLNDVEHAQKCFQEAFVIYNRTGRKKDLVVTYNCFGQIQMAKDNLEEAKEWLKKAQEASSGIDIYTQISSLNKQGQVLLRQNKQEEAAQHFERAINLSRQIFDNYQLTENLINFAEALAALGQQQKMSQLLHEAEEVSLTQNYLHFLGHLEEIRGNINYKAKEYKLAFTHYCQHCKYMARYNALAYNKALCNFIDRLLDVPNAETPIVIASSVAYWQTHNLQNDYPEFILTLEDRQNLMAFEE